MKEWDVPTSSAQSYFNNIASSDYTVPRGILQVMSESGWIKPEALRLAESQLQSLDKQGITYNALDIFDAVDPDTGGLDVNRIGQFPEQAVTKDVPQAQKIANLQSTIKNPQIVDVVDPVTNETVFSPIEEQVVKLKKDFLEAETEWQHSKKTNPLLVERNIDPLSRRRAIAVGLTLGSATVLSAVGAPFSIAGADERLKIYEQTKKPTDAIAAALEITSGFGDVSGPGGEILATAADLTLLGMDAPETYEALMHRSDPEVELAKQEQKEQDSVTSYTAQVGMDPQQRLVERSNARQQQYKDKLTAHQKGREQEKQWQLQGQDYVTQTPNIAERANQTLTKLTTDPLNEIEWGVSQMINWLNKKQD